MAFLSKQPLPSSLLPLFPQSHFPEYQQPFSEPPNTYLTLHIIEKDGICRKWCIETKRISGHLLKCRSSHDVIVLRHFLFPILFGIRLLNVTQAAPVALLQITQYNGQRSNCDFSYQWKSLLLMRYCAILIGLNKLASYLLKKPVNTTTGATKSAQQNIYFATSSAVKHEMVCMFVRMLLISVQLRPGILDSN